MPEKKNQMERTYLSKLVGESFEVVYNQFYDDKNGNKVIRIKTNSGDKMLIMSPREIEFYGKLFKKGARLRVYKNSKGYPAVTKVEEAKVDSYTKTDTPKKDDTKEISERYMKYIVKSAVETMKKSIAKALYEKKFSKESVNKVLDYVDSVVKI